MPREYTDWIEPLRKEYGDDLRMAAQYNEDEYLHLYRRDDLTEKYGLGELEDIRYELIALTLTKNRIERIARAGDHRYLISQLEEATIYLFPETGFSGRFVSLEADTDHDQSKIIDLCAF